MGRDSKELITKGLTLPDNVVIIGTVNMDDTTHQFSRKVIDRAMTIEMNGGNLRDMFGGSKNLEYTKDPEEQQKWQSAFKQKYVNADEVIEAHPEFSDKIKTVLPSRLEEINKALKGTPFEVSYRVLNELTIMVGVMLDQMNEESSFEDIVNSAINNILLMKILPRIEGDSDMFDLPKGNNYPNRLEWLKAIAPDISQKEDTEDEEENGEEADKESDKENIIDPDSSDNKKETTNDNTPSAKAKIEEMIERLNRQDFTRFWP